jgi:hypothetical protein
MTTGAWHRRGTRKSPTRKKVGAKNVILKDLGMMTKKP